MAYTIIQNELMSGWKNMSQQQHIFISYSRRNTDMMVTLRQQLTQAGFRVWTDENLVAGTPSWKNAIEQAIQNSFCIVVLMSPDSKKSEWVERELDYAYMLKRRIFPVLVDGAPQNAIPFELINIQYVDLRVDFDDKVLLLISGLRVFVENQQTIGVQETVPSDDFDTRVEARVHQLIGTLPEEVREKIDMTAIDETEGVAESEPEIEMPHTPVYLNFTGELATSDEDRAKRLAHNLQLMKWYFIAPQKFSRFRTLFLSKAPTEINAFFTMGMFLIPILIAVLVLKGEFILFHACGAYILMMVGFGIASYGSPKSSYRAYIWSILKAAIIIVFILGIMAIAMVMSSLIYYIY